MTCQKCGSEKVHKKQWRNQKRRMRCNSCGHWWTVEEVRTMSEGEPKAAIELSGNAGYVSLDSICKKFDVKAAVLREVGKIPKGKLIVESEFCLRTAGKDRNRFRRCLDNNPDELRAFRIRLIIDDSNDGKWFWGRAEDVAEALRMRDL